MDSNKRVIPDGIVFVMAYLLILSLSAFFGGVTIMSNIVPAAFQMGMGQVMALFIGIAPLVLGVLLVWSAWLLWKLRPFGRALALILASLMALIGGLSIPVLWIEEVGDSYLWFSLGGAVLLLVTSVLVIRYLTKESVRHLFFAKFVA